MQNQEKYSDYSVRDFICDESFQDWVLRPDAPDAAAWQTWLQENPGKEAVVEEARKVLESLTFRVDTPAAGRAEASLEKTWQMIDTQGQRGILRRMNRVWRVAAMGIILIGAGIFVWLWVNNRKTPVLVTTASGQLDSVLLPDRSMVVLNALSTIRYQQKWERDVPREVWLEGEALFSVQHLDQDDEVTPHERFLVHVGHTTVEVLGTRFNIRQRREKIEVALISGAVLVRFDNKARSDIRMEPGDLVVIDTSYRDITKISTNTDNYSAWTRKRLVLTNPTLQEIAHYLEDVYGKRIVLSSPDLANRKVEGPILLDSIDDALFVISTVLDVTIIKENDTITIKPR